MLNKDITFIYKDAAEKAAYEPIAEEARKRGYTVKLTDNEFERCEIGFYCQHINFPQYSKFSVIMLHDIIQQYGRWPDIWYLEPWNKYDIGILPSAQWEKNWNECSQWQYANPKIGIFRIGWPKADVAKKFQAESSRRQFYQEHNMDPAKRTILYAPAWENDYKQDDFVQAMKTLDVNILIKQGPWNSPRWLKERPDIYQNVLDMNELHKDLPGVTILDGTLNIFEAIAVSDVLVSEESSTLCEAVMMGIPAVSVTDWLIPDTIPSRLSKCEYDFVLTTTKLGLTGEVEKVINNYEEYRKKFSDISERTFNNIGSTSSMIMDIVDDCVSGQTIRYKALQPKQKENVLLKKEVKRRTEQLYRTLYANYKVQYPVFAKIWNIGKSIKDAIKH